MPLLDTTITGDLTRTFISDLVLQILSYVAETERLFINRRQAEGIRIAKEKGVKFGRPKIKREPIFQLIRDYYLGKIKTFEEAIKLSNVSKPTFFNILKEYKEIQCKK